jgi:hypothetical protein
MHITPMTLKCLGMFSMVITLLQSRDGVDMQEDHRVDTGVAISTSITKETISTDFKSMARRSHHSCLPMHSPRIVDPEVSQLEKEPRVQRVAEIHGE